MTFQVLDYKEKKFLNLINIDNLSVKPTYSKGGIWLKLIGHSNTLCARVTRTITNYMSELQSIRLYFSFSIFNLFKIGI